MAIKAALDERMSGYADSKTTDVPNRSAVNDNGYDAKTSENERNVTTAVPRTDSSTEEGPYYQSAAPNPFHPLSSASTLRSVELVDPSDANAACQPTQAEVTALLSSTDASERTYSGTLS